MKQYHDLLHSILDRGVDRGDRTGTGTRGVFGHQMRFDLAEGFPLLTTKKVHLKSIILELLWFLRGDTNIAWLKERGVSIWDEWADENGDLGPVYGAQWRAFPTRDGGTVDQISWLVAEILRNPESRRLLVSAWNPGDVPAMALPPCHCLMQFYVSPIDIEERGKLLAQKLGRAFTPEEHGQARFEQALAERKIPAGRLSCQLYQRSGDVFLGVPFNIASYALLTMMIAQVTGLLPGEFVHTLGDAHLYSNHFDQARLLLSREPRPLPVMHLDPAVTDLFGFDYGHFRLEGYDPHPAIAAPVAV